MVDSTRKTLTCTNPSGSHTISYQQWGEPGTTPPIICVHGLTRNSHDFDKLAANLSAQTQIICPDIAGRGESDHISNLEHYNYAQYANDMITLIATITEDSEHKQIDWIGTSMGGLIGMMLAAMPSSPIRRLIINDIGPYLPATALDRIAAYVGHAPSFSSLEEVELYFRTVHAPFAPMSDQDWQDMAQYGAKQTSEGTYQLTYDANIGEALRQSLTGDDMDLWQMWELITCPTLLIRGSKTDLLSKDTAKRMTTSGPNASLIEIEESGHAPSLMSNDQIAMITNWLDDTA